MGTDISVNKKENPHSTEKKQQNPTGYHFL
jgi:hypothetical protein